MYLKDVAHESFATSLSAEQQSSVSVSLVQRILNRLLPVCRLSFLSSFTNSERTLAGIVGCTLVIIVAYVVAVGYSKKQYNHGSTPILLTSGMFWLAAIVAPNHVGRADGIRLRVALYALIFLVAWIGAGLRSWPRPTLHILATLFCCLAVGGVAIRFPELSMWNERLASIYAIGQHVRPESTVLQLNLDYPAPISPENPHGVSPYLHCVGLLSCDKAVVDLRNYEASTIYFTTRFRSEVSPFPALGMPDQLESTRPIFDIRRYESKTHGRVDYLLFQGGLVSGRIEAHGLEEDLYHDQMAAYKLVTTGQRGNLRLYERVPDGSAR
jgi:hypothetical protein